MSTVAGWFTKSTASGLRGGFGRKRIGQAATLMSGAGPARGACDRPATASGPMQDLAHRHRLRATDLEDLLDRGVLLERVGGQRSHVADEDRRELLAAEVGHGHERQACERSRGSG